MDKYISFIVAARNDNYGGDFLHRIQFFINNLLWQFEKFDLDAELVIVEWNPPNDRPKLKDAIIWPQYIKRGWVRIIEVPNDLHNQFPNSDLMPMFEYLAKNVGIRRAKGEFVLATNPDLLYSEDLIKLLKSKTLKKNFFYRINRYDFSPNIPIKCSQHDQLKFCQDHTFRVASINGTKPTKFPDVIIYWMKMIPQSLLYKIKGLQENVSLPRLHTNAAGDFFLMELKNWYKMRGYPEVKTHSFIDGYACFIATALGIQQIILENNMKIFHQEHDRSEQNKRPLTDYKEYREYCLKTITTKNVQHLNSENWGCANELFNETIIEGNGKSR